MSDFDYDLFVIGGGFGGVCVVWIVVIYGVCVGIVEEYWYGGICVICGCVLKKLFVYVFKFFEEFEDVEGFGWFVGEWFFVWDKLIVVKG